MNILGDVLESILKALDAANKKPNKGGGGGGGTAGKISEEGSSSNGSGKETENNNNNNTYELMKRPWLDNLTVNRARWQNKHDDGKEQQSKAEL